MKFKEVATPVHKGKTTLPVRATEGSAGYDFHIKEDITLYPGQTHITATDVKCELAPNEVLYGHVRSSVGIKNKVVLANGTAVIDSDFYENPDNDGNIAFALYNYGEFPVTIEKGARVAQGVVHQIVIDKKQNKKRTGGTGSTGK